MAILYRIELSFYFAGRKSLALVGNSYRRQSQRRWGGERDDDRSCDLRVTRLSTIKSIPNPPLSDFLL